MVYQKNVCGINSLLLGYLDGWMSSPKIKAKNRILSKSQNYTSIIHPILHLLQMNYSMHYIMYYANILNSQIGKTNLFLKEIQCLLGCRQNCLLHILKMLRKLIYFMHIMTFSSSIYTLTAKEDQYYLMCKFFIGEGT